MKKGEVNIADHHPDVSVLVADLVGFTTLAAHIGPDQVVHLLNEIFSGFDLLALKHGLEKIKTIGDAYMVAGGIPLPRPDHAEASAELALDLMADIEKFNRAYNTSIQLRIGISTGSRRRGRYWALEVHLRPLGRHRQPRLPPGVARPGGNHPGLQPDLPTAEWQIPLRRQSQPRNQGARN